MRNFDKVINLQCLRINIGNVDAPTGKRIALFVTIVWVGRVRNYTLVSNYTGE